MAVRVVLDVPDAGGFARVMRGLGAVFGALLILVGLVAAALPVWYLLIVVDALVNDIDVTGPGADGAVVFGIALIVAWLGIALGLRLIRGRRRLGLYLRKFGFSDSTQAVTRALRSAVGRRVRMVTLDDAMVAPIGTGTLRRVVAGLIAVAFLGLTAWLLYLTYGGPYAEMVENMDSEDLAAALGAALLSVFILAVTLAAVALTGTAAIFAASAYRSARRAEEFAARTIESESAIESTARETARLSRRVFSPRLVVVRVASPIWQRAVHGLAAVSDTIIIDVSHPTDALLWEVTTMKPVFGNRWVLVGAYGQVSMLADARTGSGADARGMLARLLDGEEVLAYGHTPADHRRFVRSLRNRLHRAAAPSRRAAQRVAVR